MNNLKKLVIFDLDNTVIDSSHRYATLPNSQDIDLTFWKENCTRENIALDTLLPAIETMRAKYNTTGVMVAICTARVMSLWDWKFLRDNNVPFHYAMHRPKGCATADALLKKQQILKLAEEIGMSIHQVTKIELYDDNASVLKMARSIGINGFCALKLNRELSL